VLLDLPLGEVETIARVRRPLDVPALVGAQKHRRASGLDGLVARHREL
jgi:hypothetical protein